MESGKMKGTKEEAKSFKVANSPYNIIASAIQKVPFIQKFGKLHDDIYEIALSFVIEQAIVVLQNINPQSPLSIIIEKRGKERR